MSDAKPMSPFDRLDAYLGPDGRPKRHRLTPAQNRRISHKANRAHRAERELAAGARELTPRQTIAARVRAARIERKAGRGL